MGPRNHLGPIGHLGDRVSALLDGQLSSEHSERAWQHVHTCHQCRDLVEREGWIKTRLAGLSRSERDAEAPDDFLGSLLGGPPGEVLLAMSQGHSDAAAGRGVRRGVGFAVMGGGAIGAAMMGVLALGAAPADAPSIDRRVPSNQLQPASPTPVLGPARRTTP